MRSRNVNKLSQLDVCNSKILLTFKFLYKGCINSKLRLFHFFADHKNAVKCFKFQKLKTSKNVNEGQS